LTLHKDDDDDDDDLLLLSTEKPYSYTRSSP